MKTELERVLSRIAELRANAIDFSPAELSDLRQELRTKIWEAVERSSSPDGIAKLIEDMECLKCTDVGTLVCRRATDGRWKVRCSACGSHYPLPQLISASEPKLRGKHIRSILRAGGEPVEVKRSREAQILNKFFKGEI